MIYAVNLLWHASCAWRSMCRIEARADSRVLASNWSGDYNSTACCNTYKLASDRPDLHPCDHVRAVPACHAHGISEAIAACGKKKLCRWISAQTAGWGALLQERVLELLACTFLHVQLLVAGCGGHQHRRQWPATGPAPATALVYPGLPVPFPLWVCGWYP